MLGRGPLTPLNDPDPLPAAPVGIRRTRGRIAAENWEEKDPVLASAVHQQVEDEGVRCREAAGRQR